MKNIMKQKKTTITVSMVIAMVVVTAMVISKLMGFSFADSTFNDANGKYIVTDDTNFEAQFTGVSKKSVTSVVILSTIKIDGNEYKVTSIKSNALNGNAKVKKITIGSNVKTIGKKAFYGCKNLKTVTINTTKLTNSSVKANAFKGLNSKAVVTVPENKLIAYKKILKAKGLTGKKQVVKGKKMEVQEEKKEEEKIDPNREIPAPTTMFTIDDYFGLMSNIKETDSYSIGDSIPITMGFQMDDLMYGKWTTRTADGNGLWIACNNCGRMFDNQDDYNISGAYTMDGCVSASFNFGYDYGQPFTAWHWIPDDRACVATFHITIPEGLSYKDGTLKMFQMTKKEVADSAYHVDVNGQDITVTIDNIKDATIHDGIAEKISITLDAELNSNAAITNTVTASMSYDNGTGLKTIDLGNATIYAAAMKFRNTDTNGNDISGAEFALYKYQTLESSGGIQYHKYVKILDGITGNPCVIAGISGGKYRLVQTVVPAGYKKMDRYEFTIHMSGSNGKLNSLSADDGNRYPWDIDLETGVISTTIISN